MGNRFIIAFIGIMFGAGCMSLIYDFTLAEQGFRFVNRTGLIGQPATLIKIGWTFMCGVVGACMIFYGPRKKALSWDEMKRRSYGK